MFEVKCVTEIYKTTDIAFLAVIDYHKFLPLILIFLEYFSDRNEQLVKLDR